MTKTARFEIVWLGVVLLALTGCSARVVEAPSVQPTPAAAEQPASEPAAPADPASEAEPAEEPMPEKFENTLKWTTASELDNFGYDIYRGDSEEGPFERLTEEPLPGAGTTDEPTDYKFVDDTIDPYKTYWYYVESISLSGEREKFTPIFPSKPKLPKKEMPEEDEGGSSR